MHLITLHKILKILLLKLFSDIVSIVHIPSQLPHNRRGRFILQKNQAMIPIVGAYHFILSLLSTASQFLTFFWTEDVGIDEDSHTCGLSCTQTLLLPTTIRALDSLERLLASYSLCAFCLGSRERFQVPKKSCAIKPYWHGELENFHDRDKVKLGQWQKISLQKRKNVQSFLQSERRHKTQTQIWTISSRYERILVWMGGITTVSWILKLSSAKIPGRFYEEYI